MYNDIAQQNGKWLMLEMKTKLGIVHVTAVRLNEKNEIVFKESLDSVESKKLQGPSELEFEDWNCLVQRDNDSDDGLSTCKLFYYSATNINPKYYVHNVKEMPNY
jgi:hypothetical protein